jgi:hypothetical protein
MPKDSRERRFREYPKESIADWHRQRGLLR